MTDIEIASKAVIKPITEIGKKINIENSLECYGSKKAKIKDFPEINKRGKLILVTATNPTPYGEGKTTVSIGLVDALNYLGKSAGGALREPSLGPVFGLKGGATGGGYAQVVPMEDINLHFTGDFHAITSANNLLASAIDNHIYHGNELDIQEVRFKRCLDVNDRALRKIELDHRKETFQITAASEVMVIFCLAKDLEDLEKRLGNIIVGYNSKEEPVYAYQLKANKAMTVLLQEAFQPNLVQTLENNPIIIHGGPFANIAHGCNSIKATNTALQLFDYTVTEAGFGADLGAEKFFNIKCREANIIPDAVVLITTTKALEYNGGLENLEVHIENLQKFGVNIVVALNKYNNDKEEQIKKIEDFCKERKVEFAVANSYQEGGKGSIDLAEKVIKLASQENHFQYLYEKDEPVLEKIGKIAQEIYHASAINISEEAAQKIKKLSEKEAKYTICMAKTPASISDDPKKLGYPKDYEISVRDIDILNGAEMIVVYLNNIMTMPGLPKHANYENIYLEDDKIKGIF